MDDRVSIDPGLSRAPPEQHRPRWWLRRDQLRQLLLALAAVVFVLTATFAGFAGYRWFEAAGQRTVAEERRNEAAKQNLAFLAHQALNRGDAGTAMLLALEALPDQHADVARPYIPQAEAALFAGGERLQEVAVLSGHGHWVVNAAFSPDGRRVVTASWDMTARSGMPIHIVRSLCSRGTRPICIRRRLARTGGAS